MESNVLTQFTFHFKEIVIDEIALEGLEGITLDLLWRRVEKRFSTTLTERNKARIWSFIVSYRDISFYLLPAPRAHLTIVDRFCLVDETTGHLLDPEDYLDGPYEYSPVDNEYGSCKHYYERRLLGKSENSSLDKVMHEYGDSFVLVASLAERWRALAPQAPQTLIELLTPLHYCMLELIGKGRENGQMTVGRTNLLKLNKDPKLLFYNKKPLQELGLVGSVTLTQHSTTTRTNKAILTRLMRFHKSPLSSLPKKGKLYELAEYLKKKPNLYENVEVMIKQGIVNYKDMKRIRKCNSMFFRYQEIPKDDADSERGPKPKVPRLAGTNNQKQVKLVIDRSDSSDDDEEAAAEERAAEQLRCQSKVGVGLLRQAYERFLDAGKGGLTQVQLSQTLGVEFYTSRTICRVFKNRNIVRELLEDKGRQRMARFIAIAATGNIDDNYDKEKQQFLHYLSTPCTATEMTTEDPAPGTSTGPTGPEEVPTKKFKVDPELICKMEEQDAIKEIYSIEGFDNATSILNRNKGPTMRQLKFANGIIKVTREKIAVAGFRSLCDIVSKDINEPPMDMKAMKNFVLKLVADGQLKLFTIKWPNKNMVTYLICAPHVKANDQTLRNKYKEICMKAIITAKGKTKAESPVKSLKPLIPYAYPRYMKVKKLHEFIAYTVYFSDQPIDSGLLPGFASLVQIIPEMPMELAIGHISPSAMGNIMQLKLTDKLLQTKLKDIPPYMYRTLLQSRSLQMCLRENLKILASFGLLQLCYKSTAAVEKWYSGLLQYVFYVNRNARIIDTTGNWPRDDADVKSLERNFCFNTYDDVLEYWRAVREISTNTIVAHRRSTKLYPKAPIRHQDTVKMFDDGTIHGDGRGPCGVDSSYFLDVQRCWETLSLTSYKSTLVTTRKVPRQKRKRGPVAKPVKTKAPRKPKPRKPPQKREKIRKPVKVRSKSRRSFAVSKWEPWEDEIVMLCKVAMTIMSPLSQPGCLTVRNLVAKDILSIYDPKKGVSVCHKRAAVQESNSTMAHMNECLVNEVRRRPSLLAKYEGSLMKVRLENSLNMTRYINAARIPMMELVLILYRIKRSETFTRKKSCVAVNLAEFHKDYAITTATSNRSFNLYKTPPEFETEVSTLKEALVMVLAMKNDKELDEASSLKMYSILGSYSEAVLRFALEHLRKCGAVAMREKFINNILYRMSFQDLARTTSTYKATISSYKLSVSYARHMNCKFDAGFGDELSKKCGEHLPNPLVGTAEVNCLMLEGLVAGRVELVTLAKPSIVGVSAFVQAEQSSMNTLDAIETIDSSMKLKTGLVGWKKAGGAPPEEPDVDYKNVLETIGRSATILPACKNYPTNDKLIDFLKEQREKGSSFQKLQELTGLDVSALNGRLHELVSQQMVSRVGFLDNVIVLTEYAEPWTIPVGDKRQIPTPWITLEWSINKPVFIKWCSVVLDTLCNYPGISVASLANSCEMITARAVHDICLFLEGCKCVKLEVLREDDVDLYSDYAGVKEYNLVSVFESAHCIFVLPVKDAFCRFAKLRSRLMADESSVFFKCKDV